jgi:hypothetical protein
MTPEEALNKARELLVSEEMAPVVEKALTNAKSVPVAAATLVAPIVIKLMQDLQLPREEVLGTADGDGIAIYLLRDVFEIASEAGMVDGGPPEGEEVTEVPPEIRAMAEEAVQLLAQMLKMAEGGAAPAQQPGPPQPAPAPAQPQQGLMGAPAPGGAM